MAEALQAAPSLNAPLSGAVTAGTFGNGLSRTSSKTVTFTGADGLGLHATNTTWFTVTGQILVENISGRVTTNLAGADSTITLGVTGSTSLFIGATVGTALVTTAANWASTTPTAGGIAAPAATKEVIINANVLSAMHADNDITAGVLEINMRWKPMTPGATVV